MTVTADGDLELLPESPMQMLSEAMRQMQEDICRTMMIGAEYLQPDVPHQQTEQIGRINAEEDIETYRRLMERIIGRDVISQRDPQPDVTTEASDKSIALLKEWLSPAQLAQYERDGTFNVVGGETGKRYRIHKPAPYNISELDDKGGVVAHICVEPKRTWYRDGLSPQLADGDVMLSQKIWLEKDETDTLAIANMRDATMSGVFDGVFRHITNLYT